MSESEIWQTISLDLKRAANYMHLGRQDRAEYYLSQAKNLFIKQKPKSGLKQIQQYIKFNGSPEEILLGSTLISLRTRSI